MDKKEVLNTIKQVRENSKKRKFTQSVDMIISLAHLDIKKGQGKVSLFLTLPHKLNRDFSICAFVGQELYEKAKENCDFVISVSDFENYKGDKKKIKDLAAKYDYFLAQANIMPQVATVFGSVLGPRKKMPNPKAGLVVPPSSPVTDVVTRLKKTIRAEVREQPQIQCVVGDDSLSDEAIAENVMYVYNHVVESLPQTVNNVKAVQLKLTMGKIFKI
jgi:large subunit ribosomal protein L1